jgi:hypothetical protein
LTQKDSTDVPYTHVSALVSSSISDNMLALIDNTVRRFAPIVNNAFVTEPKPFPTQTVQQLCIQHVSGVSLFIMTLFIPIDPTLNVAYTLPFNHRVVDQNNLTDKGTFETSIADGVHLDASGTYIQRAVDIHIPCITCNAIT